MARAETKVESRIETKTETIFKQVVVLTLTEEEASILLRATAHIGGSMDGPRGHIGAIRSALFEANVNTSHHELIGSAYFKENI